MSETPLPRSHQGVGRHPCGAEPALCEAAAAVVAGTARLDDRGVPRPVPATTSAAHLDLGRVPTIFWGSQEPGAGCLLPAEAAPSP